MHPGPGGRRVEFASAAATASCRACVAALPRRQFGAQRESQLHDLRTNRGLATGCDADVTSWRGGPWANDSYMRGLEDPKLSCSVGSAHPAPRPALMNGVPRPHWVHLRIRVAMGRQMSVFHLCVNLQAKISILLKILAGTLAELLRTSTMVLLRGLLPLH
jgi:hypothetical protein